MLWLQEMTGNESGWQAWDLRYLGFATWRPTRAEVLSRAPERLASHRAWLVGHGLDVPPGSAADGGLATCTEPTTQPDVVEPAAPAPSVVESVRGNEALFQHDREPAKLGEVELCMNLLRCTRADLLNVVTGLPDELLDWDPPYASFAAWARWRTVREVLTHVALTEVGYYLPAIGYAGPGARELAPLHWTEQLRLSRESTLAFLAELADADDRLRLAEGDESWSVRKVLRRLVWHELLHLKSVRRVMGAFRER